jgi:plastocyanin
MSFGKGPVHFLAALLVWASAAAFAGAAQVTGQVSVTAANGAARASRDVSVVFWLTPLTDQAAPRLSAPHESPHPRLIQKNKVFDPHILAVQVGSRVDFPNRDPFFHNVFSLFNGKRFDLGLYEAGSTRGVHFDRAGICYIFCNIHPQMSAVVVVVDTPYFAVSDVRGEIAIANVPPGQYQLNSWEEHCSAKTLQELSRQITVGEDASSLGSIHLQESDEPVTAHLNKYGKQYDPEVFSSPLYVQP